MKKVNETMQSVAFLSIVVLFSKFVCVWENRKIQRIGFYFKYVVLCVQINQFPLWDFRNIYDVFLTKNTFFLNNFERKHKFGLFV